MPDGTNRDRFPHIPEGFTGEPWDKWPTESGAAYRGFSIFRDMGRARQLASAYRVHANKPDAIRAAGNFKDWAKAFDWRARAEAWDERGDVTREQARMQAITSVATRQIEQDVNWVDQRQETRRRELDFANRLMAKASDMLEIALIRRKVIPADPERNRPETHIYEPAKWTFKTVAEFLDLASRLRRMACELPIQVMKDERPGGAGSDEEGMFAISAGVLESVMPPGTIPGMPEDVTARPPVRLARDPGEDDLRAPPRVRPA